MFSLLAFIFCIFVITCLWLGIKYCLLLNAKTEADKAFFDLFNKLLQQYEAIANLFSQFAVLSLENRTLVQHTKKLISQAQDFSIEKDGNERIIGYANSILENVHNFLDSISLKDPENVHIKKYNYLLSVFNKTKDDYNISAQKLRHYVDTFPSSFYARLKNIRTMDFINY